MESTRFWYWVAERHNIYLRKLDGMPRPWTTDPILHYFKFTNVFRELDRTTVYFKEYTRDPVSSHIDAVFCTIAFRFFNRIETWHRLLSAGAGIRPHDWHSPDARNILQGHPPYVTGSYIIKGPAGMNKLDGCLWCIDTVQSLWPQIKAYFEETQRSLEEATMFLVRTVPYLGRFMAYEVVSDLRWTSVLRGAHDINTWANPGPGARRGLNRIQDRHFGATLAPKVAVEEMRELHAQQDWLRGAATPGPLQHVPYMEMRDIEHSLCEFDKYERARLKQGRPRGVYKP